uniref:Uncharacterized protein n=1 Tax=Picea sitchensis TaxID=3332 RepID=A0A6B9XTH2_PICSI|nr:hypothetical protein Q903MT_gene4376 [Picea sitchensis]
MVSEFSLIYVITLSSPVFPPGYFYGLISTLSVAFDALAISTFTFISAQCPGSVCMRYPGALNTAARTGTDTFRDRDPVAYP